MDKNNTSTSENAKIEEMHKKLTDLKENVADISTYFKEAFERIRSDTEDVKYNMETGSSLKIVRECVQPLIQLKSLATELFSENRNSEYKLLNQEIDTKPFLRYINEVKNRNSETREIINLFKSLTDATSKLIEEQKNQRPKVNVNESSASTSSAASDLSLSEFSLFDNSNTNAATSSPISKTGSPNTRDE